MSLRPATNSAERERVGPYVLVKAIGAGGSARVDLARIERAYGFQRHVVIKRPLEHLRADQRAAESIRREARLGARLRHPNLVAILDAGVHDGYDYLVLDYVHGGALRTLMQADDASRVRDVSLDVALTIIRDVARGVHEAHELKDERGAPLGLVHRDVSPGNVLIGLDGAVQLADFGIAKETRVATLSGSMHGTVTYMAPEQCRGHAFDRRADVFSIGVILYELVTGTRLFWADNDVASLHRVLAGTIPRPRKVRAGIPQQLEDLIMNSLAPEQDKRMPTARALADAVETYATEAGIILAARGVSRWAHDLLGPRDQPWVGDQTQIDVARHMLAPPADTEEPLPSLVDVIEATPLPQALPVPTFGPTQAGLFEDNPSDRGMMPYTAAAPEPAPTRRSRTLLVVLVGASLVGGGAAAILSSRGDSEPTAQPVAAPQQSVTDTAPLAAEPADPAVPAVPPTVPAQNIETTATDDGSAAELGSDATEAETEVETEVDDPPTVAHPKKRTRRRVKRVVQAPHTGSATTPVSKTAPKVQWDPTMLMPTDPQKKKKR